MMMMTDDDDDDDDDDGDGDKRFRDSKIFWQQSDKLVVYCRVHIRCLNELNSWYGFT